MELQPKHKTTASAAIKVDLIPQFRLLWDKEKHSDLFCEQVTLYFIKS